MNIKNAKSTKSIKPPPIIKKVAWCVACFFVVFIFFILAMPWQQTAFGSGRVLAYDPSERQQNISAPLDGRLKKWFVQEGTFVKKGDPIVELYDNDPDLLKNLLAERNAITQRYATILQAIKIAKINVKRQLELYQEGISARKSYEQAELNYTQYLNEQATVNAELTRINVRIAKQQSQLITAPTSGTILRRFSGQESVQVKTGDVIAELVPNTTSRAVEIWIDSNDVPLVRVGDIARLQFEGWPAIQFSGWPSVAVGTFGGTVAVIDAAENGQGMFRLLIVQNPQEMWPDAKYLRQGVKARGWILLRRVPLWYELWRRFNGFPPSQSGPT